MADLIGNCKCPLCSSVKARVTVSKQKLAVITCNGCQSQIFSRSDRSDELIRALVIVPAAPIAAPADASSRPAAPPAAPVEDPKPAPAVDKKTAIKRDDWAAW